MGHFSKVIHAMMVLADLFQFEGKLEKKKEKTIRK